MCWNDGCLRGERGRGSLANDAARLLFGALLLTEKNFKSKQLQGVIACKSALIRLKCCEAMCCVLFRALERSAHVRIVALPLPVHTFEA